MKSPEEVKKFLWSIIRVREKLLKDDKSKMNQAVAVGICHKLRRQLEAFPYEGDNIYFFVRDFHIDLMLIIPSNEAGKTMRKALMDLFISSFVVTDLLISLRDSSSKLIPDE